MSTLHNFVQFDPDQDCLLKHNVLPIALFMYELTFVLWVTRDEDLFLFNIVFMIWVL